MCFQHLIDCGDAALELRHSIDRRKSNFLLLEDDNEKFVNRESWLPVRLSMRLGALVASPAIKHLKNRIFKKKKKKRMLRPPWQLQIDQSILLNGVSCDYCRNSCSWIFIRQIWDFEYSIDYFDCTLSRRECKQRTMQRKYLKMLNADRNIRCADDFTILNTSNSNESYFHVSTISITALRWGVWIGFIATNKIAPPHAWCIVAPCSSCIGHRYMRAGDYIIVLMFRGMKIWFTVIQWCASSICMAVVFFPLSHVNCAKNVIHCWLARYWCAVDVRFGFQYYFFYCFCQNCNRKLFAPIVTPPWNAFVWNCIWHY